MGVIKCGSWLKEMFTIPVSLPLPMGGPPPVIIMQEEGRRKRRKVKSPRVRSSWKSKAAVPTPAGLGLVDHEAGLTEEQRNSAAMARAAQRRRSRELAEAAMVALPVDVGSEPRRALENAVEREAIVEATSVTPFNPGVGRIPRMSHQELMANSDEICDDMMYCDSDLRYNGRGPIIPYYTPGPGHYNFDEDGSIIPRVNVPSYYEDREAKKRALVARDLAAHDARYRGYASMNKVNEMRNHYRFGDDDFSDFGDI